MTIVPMARTCSRCKRTYSWNPDVGRMWCPYCGILGMPDVDRISRKNINEIFTGKKTKK